MVSGDSQEDLREEENTDNADVDVKLAQWKTVAGPITCDSQLFPGGKRQGSPCDLTGTHAS
jgi:hypothetical protein